MRTKIGVAGIALCVGTMIGFNIAGKFSLALFIVMPLVCSAFIVAGLIEARWRTRGEVHHSADDREDEHGPDGLGRSGGEPATAERRLPASGVPGLGALHPAPGDKCPLVN
jgi:hypothetical protein